MKHALHIVFITLFLLPFIAASAEAPLSVSGIYPHLAMYNENFKEAGGGETGVGAVVPWAGKLWAITYSAHKPGGSPDKLYEIAPDLTRVIREESIGGTPANRMIHKESQQLIIGPYFIDKQGEVRVIPYQKMFGRPTGNARHLTDPKNKVYLFTMEEGLYEINVHTLDVKTYYQDRNKSGVPDLIPGYHGKGAYSGQGRLVVANNGVRKGGDWRYDGPSGCLAEWDGETWTVIERHPFCEVTGPGGIYGNENTNDPIWATGWDEKSVLLMLRDEGKWHKFRLPKASNTYDAKHGWYTEWPRIRHIADDHMLMTMHGMFWDFPQTFSAKNTAGIKPLSTYLKIVVDFSQWNDCIVFGCDDTSMFRNPYPGQPQSNLWFVEEENLDDFGPPIGFAAAWKNEDVKADSPSDPLLFSSFQRRNVHLSHDSDHDVTFTFEVDQTGKGEWEPIKNITVFPHGYKNYIFQDDIKAEWIRVRTDKNAKQATAQFLFQNHDPRNALQDKPIFASLAHAGKNQPYSFGLMRPRGDEAMTLHFTASTVDANGDVNYTGYYEIGENMKLKKVDDPQAEQFLIDKTQIKGPDFTIDAASVIVTDHRGKTYRLPKTKDIYDAPGKIGWPRGIREVATERQLLNCHGIFYELPHRESKGIAKIKPICTHGRTIYDFCSWRGMMVISGAALQAKEDGHYFASNDGKTGLWFGTIDDLWQLGKPVGRGGPWLETNVKAGTPSAPYLMTGFDKKQVKLSHNLKKDVIFTIEIDPTGEGDWQRYQQFVVKKGQTASHHFPAGFSARWVRALVDEDCKATAMFTYR
ncbi:hypothetical protein GF373_03230 [bacterium]|nr:hypothetical protein [bacterium]